jgi:hypothetical protein
MLAINQTTRSHIPEERTTGTQIPQTEDVYIPYLTTKIIFIWRNNMGLVTKPSSEHVFPLPFLFFHRVSATLQAENAHSWSCH